MNDIQDLIQHALNKDYNKANEIFGDLMGQRIGDALEQEKINIANRTYNGYSEDEDVEIDDEDLEFEEDEDEEEDE